MQQSSKKVNFFNEDRSEDRRELLFFYEGKATCLICKKSVSEKPYSEGKLFKKFMLSATEFVAPEKRQALSAKILCMSGIHTL